MSLNQEVTHDMGRYLLIVHSQPGKNELHFPDFRELCSIRKLDRWSVLKGKCSPTRAYRVAGQIMSLQYR